jgi:acetyl esterase
MDLARLHPQARTALGVQQRVPLALQTLPDARRSMIEATPAEVGPGPRIDTVSDVDADGVPGRLYRDGPAEVPVPVILYAHGGGWVMGSLDTHDGLCRQLVDSTGWAVLSVEYPLAPEHPYPAAVDGVCRALDWLRTSAAAHGVDSGRIAVAGDSAGGHLAAVTARRARDAGIRLATQILICPVLDPAADYPPLDDYGLHRDEMRFFWDAFAPPGVDRAQPDLDPLRADLTGVAPAVILTAELDILRDEAERYAARLFAAGVPVVSVRYQGLIHNFPRKLALFDAAHTAIAQIAAALDRWG